jgi:hypothetical protein
MLCKLLASENMTDAVGHQKSDQISLVEGDGNVDGGGRATLPPTPWTVPPFNNDPSSPAASPSTLCQSPLQQLPSPTDVRSDDDLGTALALMVQVVRPSAFVYSLIPRTYMRYKYGLRAYTCICFLLHVYTLLRISHIDTHRIFIYQCWYTYRNAVFFDWTW